MQLTPPNSENIRQGYPPTREDLFWVETMRQIYADSMTQAHQVALIFLILSGVGILGVLFWLMAGGKYDDHLFRHWLSVVGPCLLWGVSSVYGLRTFLIRRYRYFANSPDSSRLAFKRIVRRKIRNAIWSFIFWLAGAAVLLMGILFV